MKKNYVQPQILVRNTRVKSYILSNSYKTTSTESVTGVENMLTKDRNASDDIWGTSTDTEESVW